MSYVISEKTQGVMDKITGLEEVVRGLAFLEIDHEIGRAHV